MPIGKYMPTSQNLMKKDKGQKPISDFGLKKPRSYERYEKKSFNIETQMMCFDVDGSIVIERYCDAFVSNIIKK